MGNFPRPTSWSAALFCVAAALLAGLGFVTGQRYQFVNSSVWLSAAVQLVWEHREAISIVLAFLAIGFAGKQFMDARDQGKTLQVVADSLQASAIKLAHDIGAVDEEAKAIKENTQQMMSAITSVQREAERLEKSVETINEAVHTVPPGPFVGQYGRRITNLRTRWMPALRSGDFGDQPQEALEALIRRLLHAVASQAQEYDLRNARYAANVMKFIPRTDSAPYFPKIREDQIRKFIPQPISLDYLEGILVLIEDLSVVAHTDNGPDLPGKDDRLEPVVFGVPRPENYREGDRWLVMPGAPLAVAKWNMIQANADEREAAALHDAVQGFDDVTLIGHCNEQGAHGNVFQVSSHILQAVDKYYSETPCGNHVKSFLSFPLPTVGKGSGAALGALNIHCAESTFLGPAGPLDALKRQQIYAGMMTPIVFEIAEAVEKWWEYARAGYL